MKSKHIEEKRLYWARDFRDIPGILPQGVPLVPDATRHQNLLFAGCQYVH